VVDALLDQVGEARVERQARVVGVAQPRRGDAGRVDAELGERLVGRRQQREDADRAGDRRRVGDDLVGSGRDPVAARRGRVAHRDDDRLAGGARHLELAPDQLGAEDAAAGRIDAQHERLHVLVVARLLDQVGRRQAADRSRRRLAVDDLALGDDDADRVAVTRGRTWPR
jgi:hypothetical protein